MDLKEAKRRLGEAEASLDEATFATFATFDTPHGPLEVLVTDRLRRRCRKGRVWRSTAMLTALKNAAYGLDARAPRSRGGQDGVFLVDRDHRPANSMMKKPYDRFLDKPDPPVGELATALDTDPARWTAVRLVSHHLRLLGVVFDAGDLARLVLVDYDDEKE